MLQQTLQGEEKMTTKEFVSMFKFADVVCSADMKTNCFDVNKVGLKDVISKGRLAI